MESEEQIAEKCLAAGLDGMRAAMAWRDSVPRVVNVRATERGLQSPEFVAWLFERLARPFSPGTQFAPDWMTTRFERVT